ncbi:hypothetical protein ACFPCV_36820 [Actinophytocola glycyrrhizae]|uniref:Uncharacterized protein n=1 Tax=Actinophytocola glycyrrhizae TaxID=2044873 RepID=A0ABV9SCN6_9PSEU
MFNRFTDVARRVVRDAAERVTAPARERCPERRFQGVERPERAFQGTGPSR